MNKEEIDKHKKCQLEAQIAKWKLRSLAEEWEFEQKFFINLNKLGLYPKEEK